MSTVKRKCRAVMLLTEKVSNITLIGEILYPHSKSDNGISQHLYILSDDEIKGGDYVASTYDNWMGDGKLKPQVGKVLEVKDDYYLIDAFDGNKDNKWDKGHSKKIIATTDSSLTKEMYCVSSGKYQEPLPQPSDSFVQKFIEAYNNDKPIEKVMVEYVDNGYQKMVNPEEVLPSKHQYEWVEKLEPKINYKDNTISISMVKDSWTKEEMIDFAWKTLVQGRKASTSMKDLFNELPEWFDKWVEKNL